MPKRFRTFIGANLRDTYIFAVSKIGQSLLKIAKEEGARISLGTDAHHPEQLAYMELSLAAAALAKIQPERIINFMTLTQLTKWLHSLRGSWMAGAGIPLPCRRDASRTD